MVQFSILTFYNLNFTLRKLIVTWKIHKRMFFCIGAAFSVLIERKIYCFCFDFYAQISICTVKFITLAMRLEKLIEQRLSLPSRNASYWGQNINLRMKHADMQTIFGMVSRNSKSYVKVICSRIWVLFGLATDLVFPGPSLHKMYFNKLNTFCSNFNYKPSFNDSPIQK